MEITMSDNIGVSRARLIQELSDGLVFKMSGSQLDEFREFVFKAMSSIDSAETLDVVLAIKGFAEDNRGGHTGESRFESIFSVPKDAAESIMNDTFLNSATSVLEDDQLSTLANTTGSIFCRQKEHLSSDPIEVESNSISDILVNLILNLVRRRKPGFNLDSRANSNFLIIHYRYRDMKGVIRTHFSAMWQMRN
jgi:hypothetical protein